MYAAADVFWNRMKEAEAGLPHEIMPQGWLDDRWMEQHGLNNALNRLYLALHEVETAAAGKQEGGS